MTQVNRRKFLATSVAYGALAASLPVSAPVWAEAPDVSLRPKPRPVPASALTPDQIMAKVGLSGEAGFAVARTTGAPLEGHNMDRAFAPASTLKNITACYVLDKLGADHVLRTQVWGAGQLVGDVWNGDLYLVGSGDPTLDTTRLAELAASLRSKGVRKITGGFYFDARAVPYCYEIDHGQPVQVGYNPAVSGLNLNFNRFFFEWRVSEDQISVRRDARDERLRPPVISDTIVLTDTTGPVYSYEHGASDQGVYYVSKRALRKDGGRWLPTRRPALYTAQVFSELCKLNGIVLPRPTPRNAQGNAITETRSAPIHEIVRGMLKYSTNLTAETLGLLASGAPDIATSAKKMQLWCEQRLNVPGMRFVDHSGLGDGSQMTPRQMLTALQNITLMFPDFWSLNTTRKARDLYGNLLPDVNYKIQAKTGTLNFVSALAGSITPQAQSPHIFVVMTQDQILRQNVKPEEKDNPPGLRPWLSRAHRLQYGLIHRWANQ